MTILPDLIKILFLVKRGIKLYKKYYRDYKWDVGKIQQTNRTKLKWRNKNCLRLCSKTAIKVIGQNDKH